MANSLALLLRGIREVGLRPTWDGIAHALRTRWAEAKFAQPEHPRRGLPLLWAFFRRLPIPPSAFPPAGPIVLTPGPLLSHTGSGPQVTLTFAHAILTLTSLPPDRIRVRIRPATSNQPPATSHQPPATSHQQPEFRTDRLLCSVSPDGRLAFRTLAGSLIAEEAAPVGWTADGRVVSRWTIPQDAHFYGLGQRAAGLDLRGGSYVNWNTDPRTYDTGDDPLDLCLPLLLVLHTNGQQGYGLLLENTARSRFDLGASDPDLLSIEVEEEVLEYTLFYGPALAAILERITEQTGHVPLFPLWALGYHQSRWSYYPEERVRRLAQDFRETYDVPCDAIYLDIHYMDGCRCFTWDAERFPDPARMIADLHEQGFKVVTIVDPGIKADRRYRVFREGLERGVFCRYPDGRVFIGPVWPGNCAFPDFTDPQVRTWWGEQHRGLIEAGVDGIWDDMNEPSLFGEEAATMPGPVRHSMEDQGGDHRQAHNLYGLLMARATAEGLARLRPDRRPFVLTRSGWVGVQHYAAHWTGDNRSTWESLRLTVPMVLGLGLSGVAFTGADVGGFAGSPSGELFTRWLQLGAFLPFFRAHTAINDPDQEPWAWGEPYLSINREIIRLRYRLLPYLYTALWQCAQTGMPIARPLLLEFQSDPTTWTLEDEFLCGDALLVAPVLEQGITCRSVYLPAGTWYDFWSDVRFDGPCWIEVQAPLERISLFVRAGSVIPMVSTGQGRFPPCTEALLSLQPTEPLLLHLYPGDGVSWLYEDEGDRLVYRQGVYRLTRFVLSSYRGGLQLKREVQGGFDPGYTQFALVIHDVDRPPEAVEGLPGAEVVYDPGLRILRMKGGPFAEVSLCWS